MVKKIVKLVAEVELAQRLGVSEKALREFRQKKLEAWEFEVLEKTGAVMLREAGVQKVLMVFGLKEDVPAASPAEQIDADGPGQGPEQKTSVVVPLAAPRIDQVRVVQLVPRNPRMVYGELAGRRIRVDVRRWRRKALKVGITIKATQVAADLWRVVL